MASISTDELRFFERDDDFTIVWKNLPHWTQAGTITFITWRLADSLPAAAIAVWQAERDEMLRSFGLDPDGNWKQELSRFQKVRRGHIRWSLFFAWDRRLDQAAGSCLLQDPEYSQIVLNSLLHFDGDRYVLTDAVIMPNHIHLLVGFRDQEMMFSQCTSWKHFTATEIRRRLKNQSPSAERRVYGTPVAPTTGITVHGQFWQTDQFDHLVRSEEQYSFLRDYIAKNPTKAGLKPGTCRHYSRGL